MDENRAALLFDAFINEPPEVFAGAVAEMSDLDRAFFNGYVVGYVKGVSCLQAAIDAEGKEIYSQIKTTPQAAGE